MTSLTDSANQSRPAPIDLAGLDRTDRILLGSTVGVWLAALGAAVAATVALVDLAGGYAAADGGSGTPWVLYTIIGVSAAVIAGAVPLLLRARRTAHEDAAPAPQPQPIVPEPQPPVRGVDAPTEKLRTIAPAALVESSSLPPRAVLHAPDAPVSPAVDQLWLRCAASIACAMGVATLLVCVSTYLMAIDNDTVAWVLYGLAALVTVAMIAIPWYFLRELRSHLDR